MTAAMDVYHESSRAGAAALITPACGKLRGRTICEVPVVYSSPLKALNPEQGVQQTSLHTHHSNHHISEALSCIPYSH
jgi:hypothetical protein